MIASKPIKWREFDKFLLFVGCEFKRSKGEHRIYGRQGLKRPIVVQDIIHYQSLLYVIIYVYLDYLLNQLALFTQ